MKCAKITKHKCKFCYNYTAHILTLNNVLERLESTVYVLDPPPTFDLQLSLAASVPLDIHLVGFHGTGNALQQDDNNSLYVVYTQH